MSKIVVILTAANMGPENLAEDFDAWHAFVCNNIDAGVGFEIWDVRQATAGSENEIEESGPWTADDTGNKLLARREAILSWLANKGWDAFCAYMGARAKELEAVV